MRRSPARRSASLSRHARHHGPEGRSPRAGRTGRAPRPPERRRCRAQLGLLRRLPRGALREPHASRSTARASIPARSTCASAAPATSTGPTLMYLSGGPGGAGLSEMLSVVSHAARARGSLPADRLRPARHRPLRPAALPGAREGPAPAQHVGGREVRGPPRRRPQALHDRGLGRGHGGDPRPARRREGDAVRDLLRHRARDPVRAHLPAARRAADPRLGRRPRRHRPVLHVDLPRDEPVAAVALPRPLPRDQRPTRATTSASSSRSCARSR